jgi:hypothetical protein
VAREGSCGSTPPPAAPARPAGAATDDPSQIVAGGRADLAVADRNERSGSSSTRTWWSARRTTCTSPPSRRSCWPAPSPWSWIRSHHAAARPAVRHLARHRVPGDQRLGPLLALEPARARADAADRLWIVDGTLPQQDRIRGRAHTATAPQSRLPGRGALGGSQQHAVIDYRIGGVARTLVTHYGRRLPFCLGAAARFGRDELKVSLPRPLVATLVNRDLQFYLHAIDCGTRDGRWPLVGRRTWMEELRSASPGVTSVIARPVAGPRAVHRNVVAAMSCHLRGLGKGSPGRSSRTVMNMPSRYELAHPQPDCWRYHP